METYNGHVRTPTDAIILFEACRLGLLPRVQRRLSEKERQAIRSGSVFVWDEREAGMRRWTDGKSWSASRVSGSFLTYREMEGKRGGTSFASPANKGTKSPDGTVEDQHPVVEPEEGPDGYRYKPDGLMKQSFSITTSQGQHLHLISYYSRSHPTAQILRQPSNDPALTSIKPAPGMYPESTVNDQSTVSAVARSPMLGAPNYAMTSSPPYPRPGMGHPHTYIPPGYIPHPGYVYAIDPMQSSPHYALQGYPPPQGALPPLGYPGGPYGQPSLPMNPPPPSSYDQRPLRGFENRASVPPLPLPPAAPQQNPPNLIQQNSAPPATTTHFASNRAPPHHSPQPGAYQPPTTSISQPGTYQPSGTPVSQPASIPGHSSVSLQIDPRLTGGNSSADSQPPTSNSSKPEALINESKLSENGKSNASQAPSIGALVNGLASPTVDTKPKNDTEAERQGSASPGGTRNGAPPQDIPSEKLGFREDKRALSKLDRVFARV